MISDLTIKEMMEIVGGAPEGATHTSAQSYFKENDYGVWSIWSGYWNSAFRFLEGEMYLIKDLRTVITQHYQNFEQFLTENDMPIRKTEDGYLFSNRLVYDAWVKSPELGLKKIHDLKNTKIYLQGEP